MRTLRYVALLDAMIMIYDMRGCALRQLTWTNDTL